MTTPRDAIAGLSERLMAERKARVLDPMRPANPLLLEAATQLDSLLKERDALQARVKDQQEGMETLAKEHLELARDFDKLSEMSKTSETLRKNALSVAEQWQSRATRLQQERDEAYERAAKVAENPGFIEAQDTDWDLGVNFAKGFIAAAIRRLSAGPEKA